MDVIGAFVNTISGVFNNDINLGVTFPLSSGVVRVSGVLDNQGEFNNLGGIELSQFTGVGSGVAAAAELKNSGALYNAGELRGNGNISVGNGLVIAEAGTITPGDFASFVFNPLSGSGLLLEWTIINGALGDTLRIEVVSAVPLPASVWLFLSGLAGLISIKRRKQV